MHLPYPVYRAIRMSYPVSRWPLTFQIFFRHILQVLLSGEPKKEKTIYSQEPGPLKLLHKTSSMLGSQALIVCSTG